VDEHRLGRRYENTWPSLFSRPSSDRLAAGAGAALSCWFFVLPFGVMAARSFFSSKHRHQPPRLSDDASLRALHFRLRPGIFPDAGGRPCASGDHAGVSASDRLYAGELDGAHGVAGSVHCQGDMAVITSMDRHRRAAPCMDRPSCRSKGCHTHVLESRWGVLSQPTAVVYNEVRARSWR